MSKSTGRRNRSSYSYPFSFRRREVFILLAFWGSAMCIVAVLLAFYAMRPPEVSRPVYQLNVTNAGEATALGLFPIAQAAAQAWESDVQFVSASATWDPASLASLAQPVEWVYRFYSPGLQRILFVLVTPDQQVLVRPHLDKVRRELRIVDPAQWQMDSPAAITAWLNEGRGGDWLAQTVAHIVSAQLMMNVETNRPVWAISGLNPETGESVLYTIEATTN
jgi:hypothetical protein